MISLYSNGNLTMTTDECIVFAGIVEEIQALAPSRSIAVFGDTILSSNYCRKYMAALDLVGHNPTLPHRGHGFRSMALFSRIHLFNAKYVVVLGILDVSITHSSDNVLGPIKDGYIRARGRLDLVDCERKEYRFWEYRSIRGCHPLRPGKGTLIVNGIRFDAVYLPITDVKDRHGIRGLVLTPTGEAKNEHRRIAVSSQNDDGNENQERGLEKSTKKKLHSSVRH